jgi:hypothetical protein
MESEYHVDDAASRVDSKTSALDSLDIAVNYNYMLWLTHYTEHASFTEGMRNTGNITDLSEREILKNNPYIDTLNSMNMEIGDITPEDYNENGMVNRIITQFAWGSKYNPPFVHSGDALSGIAATLGKLGK